MLGWIYIYIYIYNIRVNGHPTASRGNAKQQIKAIRGFQY